MKFNFTKFTLPALLIAASATAFADEQPVVKLATGTEPMTWSAFVNAINNPTPVKGEVATDDPAYVAWKNADDRLKTAEGNLSSKEKAQEDAQAELDKANIALNGTAEGVQPAVQGAQAAYNEAKDTQSKKATALTNAQNAYNEANDENSTAISDQADANTRLNTLNDQLTAANKEVTDLQAQLKAKYDDAIAAKQATIDANTKTNIPNAEKERDRYLRLRNALVTTTYEKETAKWFSDAKSELSNFTTAYNNYVDWLDEMDEKGEEYDPLKYSGDRPNIYVKQVTKTARKRTYNITFDSTTGKDWTAYDVVSYENTFKPSLKGANEDATWLITYYFGPDSNGKTVEIDGVSTFTYSNLLRLISNTFTSLNNNPDYQTDGKATQTITNQALYDEYDAAYEDYKGQVETLTQANKDLQGEIDDLKEAEESDALYSELETAQGNVNTITTSINTLKTELAGYTATVNKYRATSYTDADGKVIDCTDANNNPITYLKWLYNQLTKAQTEKTDADNDVAAKQEALTAAKDAVNTATTKVANAESAVTAAQSAVDQAQAAVDNAQIALNAAQKEADAAATAEAQKKYNDVTLTGDVTSDTPITSYSGTLHGDGHVITVKGGVLFTTFNGQLAEVAINGKTFTNVSNTATFTNVARWNGSEGIYYGEGTKSDDITNLGALGYQARDFFGVNFTTKVLTSLKADPNSIVYSITTKNATSSNNKQYYVQVNAEKQLIKSDNTVVDLATADNTIFAQCADTDIAGRGATNVYYGEEDNYTCDNVKITDKVAFYAPANIEAKEVTYEREFAKGWNSVCMPFDLNYSQSKAIDALCTYDKETPENFVFTKIDNSGYIPANTPILMHTTSSSTLKLGGVTIAQTADKQIVMDPGEDDDDNSECYGTFKKVLSGQFGGETQGYKFYGLVNDQTTDKTNFRAAGPNASFAAFRMAIKSGIVKNLAEAQASPRGIVIVDEKGIEIGGDFSDIEIVEMDAPSFTVAGGQGQIIITSGADMGKVDIYNLNGMLIEVADVVAGTTTVNVSKGMYIVMGQKVVVK
ncbi:MAG: hypothetical protein K2N28_07325 [Muribaculaceae bacterium]|nr:hypothetical protein [Muribaculaceae bacterium]